MSSWLNCNAKPSPYIPVSNGNSAWLNGVNPICVSVPADTAPLPPPEGPVKHFLKKDYVAFPLIGAGLGSLAGLLALPFVNRENLAKQEIEKKIASNRSRLLETSEFYKHFSDISQDYSLKIPELLKAYPEWEKALGGSDKISISHRIEVEGKPILVQLKREGKEINIALRDIAKKIMLEDKLKEYTWMLPIALPLVAGGFGALFSLPALLFYRLGKNNHPPKPDLIPIPMGTPALSSLNPFISTDTEESGL